MKAYTKRPKTAYAHQWEIREVEGYRDFGDPRARAEFDDFLGARAWTRVEPATALFEAAVSWLRIQKVLLPGVSVLARLVTEMRTGVDDRVFGVLAGAAETADIEFPARLRELLRVPEGSRISELERLRRGPTRVSGREVTAALHRASELAGIGVGEVDISGVPSNRVEALAREGLAAKAQAVARRTDARQTATLIAVVASLQASAVDDALDVFAALMATKLVRVAERTSREQKLARLPQLRKASGTLAAAIAVLLEATAPAEATEQDLGDDAGYGSAELVDIPGVLALIAEVVGREELAAAVTTVQELAPPEDDDAGGWRAELVKRYAVVRPFLLLLAEVVPFGATPSGQLVVDAVRELPELIGRKRIRDCEIRPELVIGSWRRLVTGNPELAAGTVDRHAYVLCVLEALWKALRHREVHVLGSRRWGDPRARLLTGSAWEQVRPQTVLAAGLTIDPDTHLGAQVEALDTAWRGLAAQLADTTDAGMVRVEPGRDGRTQIRVDALDRVDESPALLALREVTRRMVPQVDLPELLLEVNEATGFLSEFTPVSGGQTRMADAEVSLSAVLVALGCNIGYKPVAQPRVAALTRSRLSHVEQTYVRADTLRAANARLITAQAGIPLAQLWGGGHVASVDGLRFVVPVRTVYAGHNPRYFGRRRGATWLNAINDQVAGIGAQVVPGTPRDSLYTLDVLLNSDHGQRPEMVTSDTGSYSDLVFGLYRICGMAFAPRPADLGDTRFWRTTPAADYGPLSDLARHRVRVDKITAQWSEMLRVGGSLLTGTVHAYDLIRAFGRNGTPTPLGQAFIEYGRIAKTRHLLAVCDPDDDSYRRGINAQQNTTESRHRLARKIFYGQRGELRQSYQEGMEDQLGVLGLVLNAVVLWNTTYLNATIESLRAQGYPVTDADAARLSPLIDTHLNIHGTYTFSRPHLAGRLRPLRDPTTPTEAEE